MTYLKMIERIRSFVRRRKSKRYIKILVNKRKGEVTIETAIVFTIIMILIGSMIYLSLFLHDKVAVKSYTYSGLIEGADKDEEKCEQLVQNKLSRAPLFVIKPGINFSSDVNKYKCCIEESESSTMTFLNSVISIAAGKQEIEVVRKMPIDKMYLYKSIKDGIKNERG